MNKKLIYSIVLCSWLMLSRESLAQQPQNWRESISQGLLLSGKMAYSYVMPSLQSLTEWASNLINSLDKEKLTWYATWIGLGLGGYTALRYRAKTIEAQRKKQREEQKQTAENYQMMLPSTATDTDDGQSNNTKMITNNDYFNIGTFLYYAQSCALPNSLKICDEKKVEYSIYRFENYILPILKKSMPPRPEILTKYEQNNIEDAEKEVKLAEIKNNKDIQRYYDGVETYWSNIILMATIKLKEKDPSMLLKKFPDEYLKIIQSYLQENDPIKKSIADALSGNPTKSRKFN